jgi:RNA polymerase sigma-54 factor
MQLTQSASLRQEMRQLLTPRMIQSMEILQLPLLALEERLEQELQANPVLELKEGNDEEAVPETVVENEKLERESLVVDEKSNQADDFDRLARIAEYLENEEYSPGDSANYRHRNSGLDDNDRDRKLDAMANTAALEESLSENLMNQWAMVECPHELAVAGEVLISYIDDDGYLRTPLEVIQSELKKPVTLENLQRALVLVQTLDPAGVGARNLPECLRLQLDRLEEEGEEDDLKEHDFELERQLIANHLKDLEMNRYPQISRKTGRSIDDIKHAVKQLGRLQARPGRLLGRSNNQPITPDARIFFNEESGKYEIEMSRDPSSNVSLSHMYQRMLKDKTVDKKTREFLANNLRNARWLLESIDQRRSTIQRVIRAVVDAQQEFFEKGPEYLKPLPMILVADQLGIHVATVSRAVSEKWIQTPRGIYPLRRFFSGGTTNAEGEDMSWDAVKEKLKIIIDNEDKQNPLNDDEIVDRLREQGIGLARRTVAKYRKILDIATARQRRQF